MASLYKRGKTWTAVVSVVEDGKRNRLTKSGFKTKKDAEQYAYDLESQKHFGKRLTASEITFAAYFKNWYTHYKQGQVRPSTLRMYTTFENTVKNLFGDTTLKELNAKLLQAKISEYSLSHSKNTMKMLVNAIRTSLKDAVIDNYLPKDPSVRLISGGYDGKQPDDKYLEGNQFKQLQRHLYSQSDKFSAITLIGLETGMRFGEIIALNKDDINLQNMTISITKAFSSPTGQITKPKNSQSIRKIAISEQLVNYLRVYMFKVRTMQLFVNDGRYAGQYMQDSYMNKMFKRILDNAHISKKITFHGLRHSHASFLLGAGVDIAYVSRRLGHKNTLVTQKVYAHMLSSQLAEEQDKTLSALSQQTSTNGKTSALKARYKRI
ncbi:site-specific integrase [Periweissella cryptocerci]|uniref:Site-specific integrase n=1 Tax=Periweissella cryptocerci TaxID=2506420 RepID=A0A4P6YWQ7_9LACO|nr:tyrosine-type recombinase/integrase [Periweissella cryptocerci]QBO37236.1 site-specific integrase [Periweissella cryptocerci]